MAACRNLPVTLFRPYKRSRHFRYHSRFQKPACRRSVSSIEDNKQTDDAIVPIQLSPTAAYIKDYIALKAIWEALDGKNWSYNGETNPARTTWNFNKEIDMWATSRVYRWITKDASSASRSKGSEPKAEYRTPSAS